MTLRGACRCSARHGRHNFVPFRQGRRVSPKKRPPSLKWLPPGSTITDMRTTGALLLLDAEAPPVAKNAFRTAVAVVVARHARAINYARKEYGLRFLKKRMRMRNAYPTHRKVTYQVRRGCSRLLASAAHVHTTRTAAGLVLQLQRVTVHVSPYPLGFDPFVFWEALFQNNPSEAPPHVSWQPDKVSQRRL